MASQGARAPECGSVTDCVRSVQSPTSAVLVGGKMKRTGVVDVEAELPAEAAGQHGREEDGLVQGKGSGHLHDHLLRSGKHAQRSSKTKQTRGTEAGGRAGREGGQKVSKPFYCARHEKRRELATSRTWPKQDITEEMLWVCQSCAKTKTVSKCLFWCEIAFLENERQKTSTLLALRCQKTRRRNGRSPPRTVALPLFLHLHFQKYNCYSVSSGGAGSRPQERQQTRTRTERASDGNNANDAARLCSKTEASYKHRSRRWPLGYTTRQILMRRLSPQRPR